ncbi:uncharacterized protein [Anabrus simplex]|uniref:uncharacterized protein n=1 Tax=Anabrus simplex TaxID=316456 RepID=UPI0034DD53F0
MAQLGSSGLLDVARCNVELTSSLQCLQFAKKESNIDVIFDGSPASPCHSDSSGFSSLSGSGYWDTAGVSENIAQTQNLVCKAFTDQELPPVLPYQGRDLLDLWSHLNGSHTYLQPAVLPARDVNFFLNNRSIYDRLTNNERFRRSPQAFCEVCYLKHALLSSCCFSH